MAEPEPVATHRRGGNAPGGGRAKRPGGGSHKWIPPAPGRQPLPDGLNPPSGLRGPHPFTSQRFHALLNSLFKVLFNFPLRVWWGGERGVGPEADLPPPPLLSWSGQSRAPSASRGVTPHTPAGAADVPAPTSRLPRGPRGRIAGSAETRGSTGGRDQHTPGTEAGGAGGAKAPLPPARKRRGKEGGEGVTRGESGARVAPGHFPGLHLGGRRTRSASCDGPSRGATPRPSASGSGGEPRLIAKRPSDRRSPGRNPGPQGAFEVSMINVSCNSH
ncbi:hypothetical protein FQA47_011501 [Oryzias melastigma]|uniref:Uncharacterized protein n=1 Tax=Oryzias melastigma TaxID=30732 RepID=A0A834FH85_ORYME|nr:hypothetical protein FQA47_011501 [Oryzias melastigma]